MSHGLVNLTLPVVIQEIENVLDEYPEYPYHSAFAMPELRQKLIAHILSQVPNSYVANVGQESSGHAQVRHTSSLRERLRLEVIIRGSILHILRENADWLSRHLPKINRF